MQTNPFRKYAWMCVAAGALEVCSGAIAIYRHWVSTAHVGVGLGVVHLATGAMWLTVGLSSRASRDRAKE